MMLVRSSSSPVLGSLVSSLHHCETLKEVEREAEVSGLSRSSSCSFSFLNAGPSLLHPVVGDSDGGEWDFDNEVVPWPRFRRVHSESDLQRLGSFGKSSAQMAADLLLKQQSAEDAEGYGSGAQRQWSRRMSLRRTTSLTMIPSDRSDGSSLGCEDVETMCAGGIAITMSSKSIYDLKEEDTPVNSYAMSSYLDGGDASRYGVQALKEFKCDTDDEKFASAAAETASMYNPTRTTDHDPGMFHDEHLRFETEGYLEDEVHLRTSAAANVASVSGRPEYLYKVDNEVYTSTAVSDGGSLLLCNGKGCRPLKDGEKAEAMFIAGGLGMGGGGAGGGGGAWVGVSGGGGSSGWGGFGTETEAYYKKMLQVHPGDALLLRNYAKFLHEVKKDAQKAEEYFERAILANPGDGELLAVYAKIIWDNHRDQERAGNYFDQALKVAPDDSYVLAAYASFLWASEDDDEEDESPAEVDEQNKHLHSIQSCGSATTAF